LEEIYKMKTGDADSELWTFITISFSATVTKLRTLILWNLSYPSWLMNR